MSNESSVENVTKKVTLDGILSEIENVMGTDPEELEANGVEQSLIAEYIGDLTTQAQEKVDKGCQFVKLAEARMKAIKEESKRLALQAKYMENHIARFKDAWRFALETHAMTAIQGKVYKVSLRKTQAVSILDETVLPAKFQRVKTTVEPDKVGIKAALKEGVEVPGATLVENVSIAIK